MHLLLNISDRGVGGHMPGKIKRAVIHVIRVIYLFP